MTTIQVTFTFLLVCVLSSMAASREKRQASPSPAPGTGITADPELVQLLLQNQPESQGQSQGQTQGQGQDQTQGQGQSQGQGFNGGVNFSGQSFGLPTPFFNMAQMRAAMYMYLLNAMYRMQPRLFPGQAIGRSPRFLGGGLFRSADGKDGMIRTPFGMESFDGADMSFDFEI